MDKVTMYEGKQVAYKWKLPYNELEAFAMELAALTTVLDPDGVAYRSHNFDLVENFLRVKYFTDVDVSWATTPDDWAKLYDALEFDYWDYGEGNYHVGYEIYERLFEAAKLKHEATSSLSYKIGKTLESVLGDGDIVRTIAESREVNEKMVDLLKLAEIGKKESALLKFAKK